MLHRRSLNMCYNTDEELNKFKLNDGNVIFIIYVWLFNLFIKIVYIFFTVSGCDIRYNSNIWRGGSEKFHIIVPPFRHSGGSVFSASALSDGDKLVFYIFLVIQNYFGRLNEIVINFVNIVIAIQVTLFVTWDYHDSKFFYIV